MRIYFIGQKGIPTIAGGIEKHVEMLSLELVALGHEVFVYTRPYYTDKNLTEYKGIHLISLPTIKRKNLDAIYHTLRATLHVMRQDADIIHYQGIGPSLLCWIPKLFKRKSKVVSTIHSDDRQHDKWSRFAKFMLGLGARIACRVPDATIAIAKYQKDEFEKEFGGTLTYIPNGVTVQQKVAPHLITQKWGLRGDDYIFFISRFIAHKGLHHLIEAYNRLGDCGKKLVVVGGSAHTDEYTTQVENMARQNHNIIMCGFVSGQALLELYSNAYVYVIPSEYEGLSIALLELMSYGTPTIASDIVPNQEALGGEGLLFKAGDVDDLYEQLSFALTHPNEMKAMGPKLIARVAGEYSWKRIGEETGTLYERLRRN